MQNKEKQPRAISAAFLMRKVHIVFKRGGGVPDEKNLIPNSERTPEERKEIATAGGIASGAARRRKRSLKEAADLYLSPPVSDRRAFNKITRRYVDERCSKRFGT